MESTSSENIFEPPKNVPKKNWKLENGSYGLLTGMTKYNQRFQIERVPGHVRSSIKHFFICQNCGKIYWENSELEDRRFKIIKNLIVD